MLNFREHVVTDVNKFHITPLVKGLLTKLELV